MGIKWEFAGANFATNTVSRKFHVCRLPAAQVASTRVESPEASVIPTIPFDYRAFQDVFSKQADTQLPTHRAWDCAIDLLPGYKLPKGRVYSLSIPECKAMEEYIKEALNQGHIRPSSSDMLRASQLHDSWERDSDQFTAVSHRIGLPYKSRKAKI